MKNNLIGVKMYAKNLERFSSVPLPNDCKIFNRKESNSILLETKWSSKSYNLNKNHKISKQFVLANNNYDFKSFSLSSQACNDDIVWDSFSPSKTLRAICFKKKSPQSEQTFSYILEIWKDEQSSFRQLSSTDLSALKKHGPIISSVDEIGCMRWSNSETQLIFLADIYRPESKSYQSLVSESDAVNETSEVKNSVYGQSKTHVDHFGEQLTHISIPVLCLFEVELCTVSVLLATDNQSVVDANDPLGLYPEIQSKFSLPVSWCPLNAVWYPDDTGLIVRAFRYKPYSLGLIYCSQRNSALFKFSFATGQCEILDCDDRAVSLPQFSPDGQQIVWLETPAGGPHRQCCRLVVSNWAIGSESSSKSRAVVDIVYSADGGESDHFPGLFSHGLPPHCWTADSRRVVVNTIWRSCLACVVVDVELGTVRRLSSPSSGSIQILDMSSSVEDGDLLVAVCELPTNVPSLIVAWLPACGEEGTLVWHQITSNSYSPHSDLLETMSYTLLKHTPKVPHPKFGCIEFESILTAPKKKGPHPVILIPHGGPHSCYPNVFRAELVALVNAGFACLLVNYRGSFGFSQNSVLSLLGHIGTHDVEDCYQALQEVLADQRFGLDSSRVAVYGGSHGGFLVAQLIAQYPDTFRAACAVNPVINLVSMLDTTDIPDWCLVEAGLSTSAGSVPDAQLLVQSGSTALAELWSRSPLSRVAAVRTPTLVLVGQKDLRVPPSQGLEWYRALQRLGVACKLYVYPEDCHPLGRVDTDLEAKLNMFRWFCHHLDFVPE